MAMAMIPLFADDATYPSELPSIAARFLRVVVRPGRSGFISNAVEHPCPGTSRFAGCEKNDDEQYRGPAWKGHVGIHMANKGDPSRDHPSQTARQCLRKRPNTKHRNTLVHSALKFLRAKVSQAGDAIVVGVQRQPP